jgi:hypothetical protein
MMLDSPTYNIQDQKSLPKTRAIMVVELTTASRPGERSSNHQLHTAIQEEEGAPSELCKCQFTNVSDADENGSCRFSWLCTQPPLNHTYVCFIINSNSIQGTHTVEELTLNV